MNRVKTLIGLSLLIFSVFLVIKGQSIKSYFGLSIMLIGLSGILLDLYLYNKKYT